MYETIVLCLEFIIQVLQYGPPPTEYGNLPKDEIDMRLAEENTGEAREKRGKGPWSVVLWADEKHVAKEVTRQIRDALGVSWETAERYAKEVEEVVRNRILAKLMPQGRKVMVTSSNPISAFHTASMFQQIDLGVTLRSAADTFKEEIVGMLISWLADMCQCAVGGDGDLFKRLVARALNEPRMIKGPGHGTPIPSDLRRLDAPSESKRIDWLMQLDVRLWKKGKWELRSIYAGLYCLNWDVRKDLGKCREVMPSDATQPFISPSITFHCSSTTFSRTGISTATSSSASHIWCSVMGARAPMLRQMANCSRQCSMSLTLGTPIKW